MTSKEERKELMEEMQFGMLVMSTLEDPITHQKAIPGDLLTTDAAAQDDWFHVYSIKNIFARYGEGAFFACCAPEKPEDLEKWKQWAELLPEETDRHHQMLLMTKVRIGTVFNATEPKVVKLLIDAGADISTENYKVIRMAKQYYPEVYKMLRTEYPNVVRKASKLVEDPAYTESDVQEVNSHE